MNGGTSTGEAALARALWESRAEDGGLGSALAGLLAHLRGYPYGRFRGRPEEALYLDADRFVARLAEHLRYGEETLFPALQSVEPGFAGDMEELKQDHRLLRHCARDLAVQIRGGGHEGAYGVARTFLAVLLDHTRREAERVDRIVRSLDVLDAGRVSAALGGRRPPSGTGR